MCFSFVQVHKHINLQIYFHTLKKQWSAVDSENPYKRRIGPRIGISSFFADAIDPSAQLGDISCSGHPERYIDNDVFNTTTPMDLWYSCRLSPKTHWLMFSSWNEHTLPNPTADLNWIKQQWLTYTRTCTMPNGCAPATADRSSRYADQIPRHDSFSQMLQVALNWPCKRKRNAISWNWGRGWCDRYYWWKQGGEHSKQHRLRIKRQWFFFISHYQKLWTKKRQSDRKNEVER